MVEAAGRGRPAQRGARGAGAGDRPLIGFSPQEWAAIGLSLKVASVGALASLPFGVAVAWLSHGGGFRQGAGRRPGVSAAGAAAGHHRLGAADRLRPAGVFGRVAEVCCGVVLAFRWTGAALAAAIMGFPLMVRTIRLSIEAVDARLEEAAETLGAPPLAVFLTVTLPLALPGVVAGLILGFARAIGEFGATITFVANIPGETQTIATAIYGLHAAARRRDRHPAPHRWSRSSSPSARSSLRMLARRVSGGWPTGDRNRRRPFVWRVSASTRGSRREVACSRCAARRGPARPPC